MGCVSSKKKQQLYKEGEPEQKKPQQQVIQLNDADAQKADTKVPETVVVQPPQQNPVQETAKPVVQQQKPPVQVDKNAGHKTQKMAKATTGIIHNEFYDKFKKQINKLRKILADFSLFGGDQSTQETKSSGAMQIKGNEDLVTLEVIGKGGQGSVSKVFHRGIKKFLALKQSLVDDEADALDFSELEILAELAIHSNPKISKVLGVEIQEKEKQLEYYLLSELGECSFENIAIAKKKQESRWSESQLLYILKSVCEPLEFLASLKIAHRDLKPHNIVLEADLISIKLIDFGISVRTKLNSEGKMKCIMAGTPYYMPPEAITAMDNEDPEIYCNPYKWDSYSLGKTIVALVDMDAVKSPELLEEALTEISDQYPNLYSILKKLLDKEPENRPSIQEVLREIGDVNINELVTQDEFNYVVQKIRMKNVKGEPEDIKKLAAFYLRVADFNNANAYLESLLNKYEDDDDDKSKGIIASLNLLMGKVKYFTAQYDQANQFLSTALRMYLTDIDAEANESTEPLVYLGRLNQEIGERQKAINYAERAYNVRKEGLGEKHIQTLEAAVYYAQYIILQRVKTELQDKLVQFIGEQIELPQVKETEIGTKAIEIYGWYKLRKKQYDVALKLYEEALSNYQKQFGENSLEVATIYYKLGYYYQEKSQYDKGMEYYNKCKVIRTKLLGENHPLLGDVHSGLGWLYYRQNKSVECWDEFDRCRELYEQGYGEKSLITASAYYSVGVVRKWYRKYDEAEQLLKKCYEIRKEKLGENHSDVSPCCVVLGNLNNDQGKYKEAREYYQLGLKIALDNKEELDQAFNYYNLGDIHLKCSEFEEAIENFQKAYEIRLQILGENDNLTLFSSKQLCDTKLKLGQYEEALKGVKQFVEGQAKIFGINNNSTSWAYWYRAQYYYHIGMYSQAIDDCEKAQKTLATNTLVRSIIGYCWLQQGDAHKGFKEVETCLSTRKSGFVDKDLNFAEYYLFYCEYYLIVKNYSMVHHYATEISYIPKSKFYWLKYHELIAESLYFHGMAYLRENKNEEAFQNLEDALQQANKIYGKDKIGCAKFNAAIAEYYLITDEPQKAKTYLDRALTALQTEKICLETQSYGDVLFLYAKYSKQNGDNSKAKDFCEKALNSYRVQFSEKHRKINEVFEFQKSIN